jgi:hypothetical protein
MTASRNRRPQLPQRAADLVEDPDAIDKLPPYEPFQDIRKPVRRYKRGSYMTPMIIDGLLTRYIPDMQAGIPDHLIGRRVGLSPSQVKRWRGKKEIVGRRGPTPPLMGAQFMLGAMLGEQTAAVEHEFSVVRGTWRPPAYALRCPLNYNLFVKMVVTLIKVFSVEEIAAGIGIEARDVELAFIMSERGEK